MNQGREKGYLNHCVMLFGGPIDEPSFPFVVGYFCPKESSLLIIGTTASPLLLPPTPNALE